jgi:peptide/nickel transport system substrate-binding protein
MFGITKLRLGRARIAFGVIAIAGLAAACSSAGQATTAATTGSTGTLVVNEAVAPSTLDPAEACGVTDLSVIDQIYATLVQFGTEPGPGGTTKADQSEVLPYLATSWTTSDGGTVYTFNLRHGVTFPNGDPLNAAAVKFSLERAITLGGCGTAAVEDLNPDLIKSVQTPSSYVVTITLANPDPEFVKNLAEPQVSILDPSVVDAHGGVQAGQVNQWVAGNAAGVGPFLLKSYRANSQAVLVANPKFFVHPASKQIVINYIDSDSTLLLDARSGAANVTVGMSSQSVHSLAGDSAVRIIANPTAISEQIGFLNTVAPFNNVKFREALSYAVPDSQILSKIADGYGTLFYGPIPPAIPGYSASLEAPRSYDLARAKSLIAASGVKTPVTVDLAVELGSTTDQQLATTVQSIWQQLGVNLQIQTLAPAPYNTDLQAHKLQAWIRLDGPFLNSAGFYLAYDMMAGFPQNNTQMSIPAADTLLEKARTAPSTEPLQPIWNQIIALWNADSPKIPIYAADDTTVLNKNVTHYFYSSSPSFVTWAAGS